MSSNIGRVINHARNESIRSMIAQGLHAGEIADALGYTPRHVLKLVLAYGLGPWLRTRRADRPSVADVIPADFAEQYAEHSQKELCSIYKCSSQTITIWVQRSGIIKRRIPRAKPARHTPRLHNAWRPTLAGRQPVDRAHRDETQAGQAADYLRRFGPVIRCNAQGHYDPKGTLWLRGSTILNADEVIDRATRNGWHRWDVAA